MSKPHLERNLEIVKLRLKDPEKWTFTALKKKYGFKAKSTVHQIYNTFLPKYKALVDKSVR